ncbi:MAG: hypothetical protein LBS84_05355 [Clostridiales bacterium]|jgi:ATP-dependent Lhr-like helicase|nr:hypothetical protein [Clostridiales bacterium]
MMAKLALEGRMERCRPPRGCWDVLAQHMVSMAATEAFDVDDILSLTARAYPFAGVEAETVRGLLRMLAGDFEHNRDIPVRPRLLYDHVNERVEGDNYSRMLALNAGGSIPDKGPFAAKTEAGVRLGELDEEFVFEARVGDRFLLVAFAWKILSISRDTVTVAPSSVSGVSRRIAAVLERGRVWPRDRNRRGFRGYDERFPGSLGKRQAAGSFG